MPDQDPATMLYRIQSLEQQLRQVQEQLKAYVPIRENELQLAAIQASVTRIERDVISMKAKQEDMEKDARLHDEERKVSEEKQRLSQANLQVRVLWGVITAISVVTSGIFIGFVNHFWH